METTENCRYMNINNFKKMIVYDIFRTNDTPHRLALGLAIGLFLAMTPTVGFQILLTFFIAPLFGGNGRVGSLMAWISNPLTMLWVYWFNYEVGHRLLELFGDRPDVTMEHIRMILKGYTAEELMEPIPFHERMGHLFDHLSMMSGDLWLGSVVVGTVTAIPMYFVSRRLIEIYRRKHPVEEMGDNQ